MGLHKASFRKSVLDFNRFPFFAFIPTLSLNMASESNQHILAGAQSPIIYGGTFTNVGGNMTINTKERPGKQVIAVI